MIIFDREMTITQEIEWRMVSTRVRLDAGKPSKWLIQKNYDEGFQGSI